MAANHDQFQEVEGVWDDLVRRSSQFGGRRVRITVLSDEGAVASNLQSEVRRWLAEGDALEIVPRPDRKTNAFGDALVEKFRKQGLAL